MGKSAVLVKNDFDSPMARQARNIPNLIIEQFTDLEPKTRELFSTEEIYSFQKIVLTGCGDSYAACLAAKAAFEDFARVPVEVVTVVDLARHYAERNLNYGPNSPLVIAVSNSGSVARLHEAILRANTTSSFTLGITKNPDSPLGQNSKRILKLDPPDFESAPGVGSYMISLIALLLLAIRLGEVKLTYTMNKADVYRESIRNASDHIQSRLHSWDRDVLKLAHAWKDFPGFDFVGSGADYGTVFFGHAKIIEAVGSYAMHINTEEWLHLNFFLRNSENTGTVAVIDRVNTSMSRMREVIEYMKINKRPLVVITNDDTIVDDEITIFKYQEVDHISFAALYQMVPISLFSAYVSSLLGEEYGRGTKGYWEFSRDAKAIKHSKICII